MERLEVSFTPKGQSILTERDLPLADHWSVDALCVNLHAVDGMVIARGHLSMIGRTILPRLETIDLRSVANLDQRSSRKIAKRRYDRVGAFVI